MLGGVTLRETQHLDEILDTNTECIYKHDSMWAVCSNEDGSLLESMKKLLGDCKKSFSDTVVSLKQWIGDPTDHEEFVASMRIFTSLDTLAMTPIFYTEKLRAEQMKMFARRYMSVVQAHGKMDRLFWFDFLTKHSVPQVEAIKSAYALDYSLNIVSNVLHTHPGDRNTVHMGCYIRSQIASIETNSDMFSDQINEAWRHQLIDAASHRSLFYIRTQVLPMFNGVLFDKENTDEDLMKIWGTAKEVYSHHFKILNAQAKDIVADLDNYMNRIVSSDPDSNSNEPCPPNCLWEPVSPKLNGGTGSHLQSIMTPRSERCIRILAGIDQAGSSQTEVVANFGERDVLVEYLSKNSGQNRDYLLKNRMVIKPSSATTQQHPLVKKGYKISCVSIGKESDERTRSLIRKLGLEKSAFSLAVLSSQLPNVIRYYPIMFKTKDGHIEYIALMMPSGKPCKLNNIKQRVGAYMAIFGKEKKEKKKEKKKKKSRKRRWRPDDEYSDKMMKTLRAIKQPRNATTDPEVSEDRSEECAIPGCGRPFERGCVNPECSYNQHPEAGVCEHHLKKNRWRCTTKNGRRGPQCEASGCPACMYPSQDETVSCEECWTRYYSTNNCLARQYFVRAEDAKNMRDGREDILVTKCPSRTCRFNGTYKNPGGSSTGYYVEVGDLRTCATCGREESCVACSIAIRDENTDQVHYYCSDVCSEKRVRLTGSKSFICQQLNGVFFTKN